MYSQPHSLHARALILGAGVAGLAAAIGLERIGVRPLVHEREGEHARGHAFLLLGNGLRALDALGLGASVCARGVWLDHAEIRDGAGRLSHREVLPDCLVLTRADLLACLHSGLRQVQVTYHSRAAELVCGADGRIHSAVVETPHGSARLATDLVLGCDGGRSLVRKFVAPASQRRRGQVDELVLLLEEAQVARDLGRGLLKVHDLGRGLAAGLAPVTDGRVVWWLQFDTARHKPHGDDASELQRFALESCAHFGEDLCAPLRRAEFDKAHWWRTGDALPLESFQRANAVVLGDAAHPFLPFTSQGANMALVDAMRLAAALEAHTELDAALVAYSRATRPDAVAHHAAGVALERNFVQGAPSMATLPRSEACVS